MLTIAPRSFLLSIALASFAAAGCDTPDEASESADVTASVEDALIVCNDGALTVEKASDNEWEHVVTVHDQGVVDWFVEQSEGVVEGRSSAGGTRLVEAELPWQVAIENLDDGSRLLVLRELRRNEDLSLFRTSGPPGSSLERAGDGMRLTIANAFMPNSKEVVDYEVGSWYFESCAAQDATEDAPATGARLGGAYAGPRGASLTIEAGEARVLLPDGNAVAGTLDRDGTLGGSYSIVVPEGFVCGTYDLSLWESEGVLGDGSKVELRWRKPEGSIAASCGYMQAGEGSYLRR